jgi:hypothetical protein
MCRLKTIHATRDKDLQLSNKSAMWVTKLLYKEGTSQDMRGVCSNNYCGSFTILDNILTVGESAGSGRATWSASPTPRSLLCRRSRGV